MHNQTIPVSKIYSISRDYGVAYISIEPQHPPHNLVENSYVGNHPTRKLLLKNNTSKPSFNWKKNY
jgi:hypothetical protein